MRISLVTETFAPEINGVARTLGELCRGLASRGHSLHLIRPAQKSDDGRPSGPWDLTLTRGFPIPSYPGLRFGFPAYFRLKSLWRRDRPDVVHIATEGPLGFSALFAARALGIEVCSSFHTNFHQYGNFYGGSSAARLAVAGLRAFHDRAAATLVPTEDVRALLVRKGFRRLDVLSRGVDTRLFSPARRCRALRRDWGASETQPVVAYVGRLAAEKNPDLAVKAFRRLRREVPEAVLLVVGDGPSRAVMEEACRDLSVIFAGMRRGEDLATFYASADVLISPSSTETFGNVVLEAMASGLPVVSYDYAAGRLLMEDGKHGRLVPTGDEDAWLEAVVELASRPPAERLALGERCRARAERQRWVDVVARFEAQLIAVKECRFQALEDPAPRRPVTAPRSTVRSAELSAAP